MDKRQLTTPVLDKHLPYQCLQLKKNVGRYLKCPLPSHSFLATALSRSRSRWIRSRSQEHWAQGQYKEFTLHGMPVHYRVTLHVHTHSHTPNQSTKWNVFERLKENLRTWKKLKAAKNHTDSNRSPTGKPGAGNATFTFMAFGRHPYPAQLTFVSSSKRNRFLAYNRISKSAKYS